LAQTVEVEVRKKEITQKKEEKERREDDKEILSKDSSPQIAINGCTEFPS